MAFISDMQAVARLVTWVLEVRRWAINKQSTIIAFVWLIWWVTWRVGRNLGFHEIMQTPVSVLGLPHYDTTWADGHRPRLPISR
jgi:hypothetical protein